MRRMSCRCFCGWTLALTSTLALASPLVEWDFPREGSCHEGLAFADGVTGVLVWGGGETIRLTVGRSDLWDHRGGYDWLPSQSYTNIVALVRAGKKDELLGLFKQESPPGWKGSRYNPYMLPLGRVEVTVPGLKLMRGELDTHRGIGRLIGADGRVIELAMSVKSRTFTMRFPEGCDYSVQTRHCLDFPTAREVLVPRGFAPAKRHQPENAGGFVWTLPADEPVSLAWVRQGRELAMATARGEGPAIPKAGFGRIREEAIAQWSAFWAQGARVKVPDPIIQQIFDYGMYRYGAMTDPHGVPAGLQGPWLEDDRLVPWNGDYHFNINVQECYSPSYRGGHFEHLKPLFRMVLSWKERLRANARQFVGIDDGLVLPHSVDDRGVCIGGFWTGTIDHASTAWMAALMFRYVRYSGDVGFLKDGAYDFMKGAMNVYLAMMEDTGDALAIPLGPSPEWCGADVQKAVGRNPSFQLAAAHRLARDLIAAAALLGETPDARWLDVERRLPACTVGPGGIQLFEGQPFVVSHRHHSHMAGIYPFDTLVTEDGRRHPAVGQTYGTWVFRGPGEWSGWCLPWAAILHLHMGSAEAAVETLHSWKTFFNNPGHGSLHDAFRKGYTIFTARPTIMQMDGQCAAVTAVLEMMAHETGGKPEFFKGCPESWKDVSFENLALSDGRRVSGRRLNGKVTVR